MHDENSLDHQFVVPESLDRFGIGIVGAEKNIRFP